MGLDNREWNPIHDSHFPLHWMPEELRGLSHVFWNRSTSFRGARTISQWHENLYTSTWHPEFKNTRGKITPAGPISSNFTKGFTNRQTYAKGAFKTLPGLMDWKCKCKKSKWKVKNVRKNFRKSAQITRWDTYPRVQVNDQFNMTPLDWFDLWCCQWSCLQQLLNISHEEEKIFHFWAILVDLECKRKAFPTGSYPGHRACSWVRRPPRHAQPGSDPDTGCWRFRCTHHRGSTSSQGTVRPRYPESGK